MEGKVKKRKNISSHLIFMKGDDEKFHKIIASHKNDYENYVVWMMMMFFFVYGFFIYFPLLLLYLSCSSFFINSIKHMYYMAEETYFSSLFFAWLLCLL